MSTDMSATRCHAQTPTWGLTFGFFRRKKAAAPISSASTTQPPTTPPTIAASGTLSSSEGDDGGGATTMVMVKDSTVTARSVDAVAASGSAAVRELSTCPKPRRREGGERI